MMKIRTIKPAFFTDEKIGNLPISARLLFIGMWMLADDNGILRGNHALLKSQIFPYDDSLRVGEVSKWLNALVEARIVEPISYRGESFYRIRTFRAHQKIDPRYQNTLIPIEDIEPIKEEKRVPDVSPAMEVEVEYSYTQKLVNNTPPKNLITGAHAREQEAFELLTGKWQDGFAPNMKHFAQQLTKKQFDLLRKEYDLADIARLMFAISSKTDIQRLPDGSSVYATICTYASNDKRIREQREARAFNESLSVEGLARGTVTKRPVPRTTRISNPELGYIFDYET